MRAQHILLTALLLLAPAGALASGGFGSDSSIELIAPTAGATYRVGNPLTVQWVMHNGAAPNGGVAVLISGDEGRSWIRVVSEGIQTGDPAFYQDSVGTFTWTIIDSAVYYSDVYVHFVSDKCMAMVGAPYDEVFAAGYSDNFTILPGSTAARSPSDPIRNTRREIAIDLSGKQVDLFGIDGRRLPIQNHVLPRLYTGSTAPGVQITRIQNGEQSEIMNRISYR